jgi:hypothetical protein
MVGGGLMQMVAYGAQDIILMPTHFICDVEMLTLGRVYNTFEVINPYYDDFSDALTISNFYDIIFNL